MTLSSRTAWPGPWPAGNVWRRLSQAEQKAYCAARWAAYEEHKRQRLEVSDRRRREIRQGRAGQAAASAPPTRDHAARGAGDTVRVREILQLHQRLTAR